MSMYNFIEYRESYSKRTGSLWQYYRDDPNDNITQSESFKYNIKITVKAAVAGNAKDDSIVEVKKVFYNKGNFPQSRKFLAMKEIFYYQVNFLLSRRFL